MNEERIIKYIEDELNESERIAFEKEVAANPAFAKEFDAYKQTYSLVRDFGRMKMKEKLQDHENDTYVKMGRRNFWPWILAAALVLGIPTLYFLLKSQKEIPTQDQIFAEYFESYRSPPNLRNEGAADLRNQAFQYMRNKNYTAAIDEFEKIEAPNIEDQFYFGQALLEINQYEKAVKIFADISSIRSDYQYPSLWYGALAAIQTGDLLLATKLFKELVNEGTYKSKESAAIIDRLN